MQRLSLKVDREIEVQVFRNELVRVGEGEIVVRARVWHSRYFFLRAGQTCQRKRDKNTKGHCSNHSLYRGERVRRNSAYLPAMQLRRCAGREVRVVQW